MIERIKTKNKKKIGKFYDKIYKYGGYYSDYKFNKKILDILETEGKKGARLLDVACGQGTLLAQAERFAETYGIDISSEALKRAKKNAKNTIFRRASADKLPFNDSFFDYVTCMGSLEHFPDIGKSLFEIKRVLKKDGIAIIHVPNSQYIVHKILGIDTQGQINERLATEKEWSELIGKFFKIKGVRKYNTRWFFQWIPKRYCCHFTFICKK